MKKWFLLFLLVAVSAEVSSQILDPVKWKTRTERISDTEFHLVFEGAIESDWHVYSQFTPPDGPLPLELVFENQKGNFNLVGKAKESPYKKQFNDVFKVDEYYFDKSVTLRQRVKITNPNLSKLSVAVNYQVCKDVCINQDKEFTFDIPTISKTAPNSPTKTDIHTTVIDTPAVKQAEIASVPTIDKPFKPAKNEERGLLSIFFLAFLGGFAALLTPCVFPMIPMTVSFFTKQSKTKAQGKRNAVIYGISIIAIYLVLGSIVTAVFGAEALNELSTNVWFNIAFFVLLVVFAFSFLGAFEIMLPNSWANKVDRQADRGGIIGILFMALALAIVSFSCTGPIVGTLLVQSASSGGIAPVVGMFGFSTALALPFMLFAMFPGWLNSLPKSGG
ncbi:MAG TPA: cytochrome c biogenesis protein CcdA, partial [Flavobacterium sp.]